MIVVLMVNVIYKQEYVIVNNNIGEKIVQF